MLNVVQKENIFEFYNEDNTGVGSVTTKLTQDTITIDSVYTVHEFRGQGMARLMMDGVYQYAQENKLEIIPVCSYAVSYMEKKGHE
ncbi:MAG: GNAT family N-acetyltransferase [Culicoidibacterales bacterium]